MRECQHSGALEGEESGKLGTDNLGNVPYIFVPSVFLLLLLLYYSWKVRRLS